MDLPKRFLERMENLLSPKEYQKLIESYGDEKYKGIRVNTLKTNGDNLQKILPFEMEAVEWCKTGYYIDREIRPGKNPAYYAGLYYVQEPTAMTSAEALAPKPGDWVLDLCAAPGGKSTQLACMLQGEGLLVSNELIQSRTKILASNMERMGVENAVILGEFPEHLVDVFYESFDKILVDAPCSGEGMFRKEPSALEGWSEEQVIRCAERQKKILESVDKLLKPNGILVYSTCTFAPEENEEMIEHLLESGRYETESIKLNGLVETGRPEWTKNNCQGVTDSVRIMPWAVKGEGHYVAKLKKIASSGEKQETGKLKPRGKLKRPSKQDLKDYEVFAKTYLKNKHFDNLYLFGEKLFSLPSEIEYSQIESLRVHRAGIHLGDLKKNRFEPSHSLAMVLKKEVFTQVYEVADDDEANTYLKGEPLTATSVKGWTLVCWKGFPLGFGKASQGLIKNHYPKGLRIKKK